MNLVKTKTQYSTIFDAQRDNKGKGIKAKSVRKILAKIGR